MAAREFVTTVGASSGSTVTGISPSEKGQPGGVATLDSGGVVPTAQLPDPALTPSASTVYVAKHGSNADDGLALDRPKLTLGAALTAAAALLVAGAPGVRVEVVDGGEYTENITVPSQVYVNASAATLRGTVGMDAGAEVFVDRQFSTSDNQALVTLDNAGEGPAIFQCNVQDGRGHTGVQNVRNIGGGGKNLFARVGIMYVGVDGVGVGDFTSGFGHIHVEIEDLYLGGSGGVGISAGALGGPNAAYIVGIIHHILPITPEPASTTAIRLSNAAAVVRLVAAEVRAVTAYDITAGSLNLMTPFIEGARVGTPVFELSPMTFPEGA